jgi:hypothetical protein
VCLLLGDFTPKTQQFMGFLDDLYEDFDLFSCEQRASHLEHFAPIVIFLHLFYRIRTAWTTSSIPYATTEPSGVAHELPDVEA